MKAINGKQNWKKTIELKPQNYILSFKKVLCAHIHNGVALQKKVI